MKEIEKAIVFYKKRKKSSLIALSLFSLSMFGLAIGYLIYLPQIW